MMPMILRVFLPKQAEIWWDAQSRIVRTVLTCLLLAVAMAYFCGFMLMQLALMTPVDEPYTYWLVAFYFGTILPALVYLVYSGTKD